MKFYQENAKSYSESTFNQDFAKAVFDGFSYLLVMTSKNKSILDIGCGSGRDANYMTELGFDIDAFDQSSEMIAEAKRLTGLDNVFNVGSAQLFETEKTYDFAYSIACLLHLDDREFGFAIENIAKHMNKNGIFYFTVKKGTGEETDGAGRYFNYYTEQKLRSVFADSSFDFVSVNENQDLTRPDTTWLNVVVRKK